MIMTNDNERRKGKSVCSGVDGSISIGRSSVSQWQMDSCLDEIVILGRMIFARVDFRFFAYVS